MLQIHEKIAQARVSAGLSQEEIAEKLGISRTTYQNWEKTTPSIKKVLRVAKVLGLPKDHFFDSADLETEAISERVFSHDALLAVLIDEISSLKALATGENQSVLRQKIIKAAEDVARLGSGNLKS